MKKQILVPKEISDAIPGFDESYGLVVRGDCMAPLVLGGDTVLAGPGEEPRAGDLVAIWPTKEQDGSIIKRLDLGLPPPGTMNPSPGSNVCGVIIVSQINPVKRIQIKGPAVKTVHKIFAVYRPDGDIWRLTNQMNVEVIAAA